MQTPTVGTPLAHRFPITKFLLLLLGAGFLIKLDATGYAANALGRISPKSAPAMQSLRGGQPALQLATATRVPGGIEIQGESLRTWEYRDPNVEMVKVDLSTFGRPLEATVEVWNAAGNSPFQSRWYSEDGGIRPIEVMLAVPRGPSTVAVRNVGQVELPLTAVVADWAGGPSPEHQNVAQKIQGGGSQRSFTMDPNVEMVEVMLKSDGTPMSARIEILQGPDTNKQVIELYSENGADRPFVANFAAPMSGNVFRLINTGPMEYPLTASVVPVGPSGGPAPGAVFPGGQNVPPPTVPRTGEPPESTQPDTDARME